MTFSGETMIQASDLQTIFDFLLLAADTVRELKEDNENLLIEIEELGEALEDTYDQEVSDKLAEISAKISELTEEFDAEPADTQEPSETSDSEPTAESQAIADAVYEDEANKEVPVGEQTADATEAPEILEIQEASETSTEVPYEATPVA